MEAEKIESIINPWVLVSSSRLGKKMVMSADLEFLDYNKRNKTLVKKIKIKMRSIIGQALVSVAEHLILDAKKAILIDLVEVGITSNKATFYKAKQQEKYIIILEWKIHELEEQLATAKSSKVLNNMLKEYALSTLEAHANT